MSFVGIHGQSSISQRSLAIVIMSRSGDDTKDSFTVFDHVNSMIVN